MVHVGVRLREIREQRNLSLRALAEQCRLSTNAISLIERGDSSPTVSTLQRLATALGLPITEFFEQKDNDPVVMTRRGSRLQAEGAGVRMQSLGTGLKNQQIEPFIIAIEPGSDPGEAVEHPGQELAYCTAGEVRYVVDGRVYELEAGDSVLFDAGLPHYFWNASSESAEMLLIFSAGSRADLARRRHLRHS